MDSNRPPWADEDLDLDDVEEGDSTDAIVAADDTGLVKNEVDIVDVELEPD